MVQYEIKITGRVQGVGFRYYTQKVARDLELNGWVKNTTDKAVLVTVQGNEKDIETFIDYLRIGPALARVNKISKYKMPATKKFSDFEVKY
jgi:acylphosphatase